MLLVVGMRVPARFPCCVPQALQKTESSASCVPHFEQNMVISPFELNFQSDNIALQNR